MTSTDTAAVAADTASVDTFEPPVDGPASPVDGPTVEVNAGGVDISARPADVGVMPVRGMADAAMQALQEQDPEAQRRAAEQFRLAAEQMIADMVPRIVDIGIARLDVRPGDTVVLRIDHPLRWEARLRAQQHMQAILPPGVSALLLEPGAELKIINGSAVAAASSTEHG